MIKRIWDKVLFILFCVVLVLTVGIKRNIFTTAYNQLQTVDSYGVVINEVMSDNRNSIQDNNGDYSDYIELYNNSDVPINLKGFGLSTDVKNPFMWQFPEVILEPHSFLVVWASGNADYETRHLHTNFKLKKKDETLILTSPDGTWKTIFLLHDMYENISCGRIPDGSDTIAWFDGETAGSENTLEPLKEGCASKRLADVSFSKPGGFYEDEIVLTLTHEDSDAQIYYTLDGSDPTTESILYEGEIKIPQKSNEATVIRARAFKAGFPSSNIVTNSYFVEKGIHTKYDIPVLSIVTDPDNLFDYRKGIYVAGKVRDDWIEAHPTEVIDSGTPANYNQEGKKWERQAHLEIFRPDGKAELRQGIGIRTHGGYSLAHENKTLKLLARNDYDDNAVFNYDFFPNDTENDLPVTGVIMRNSGTDAHSTFFRDAFIQSLADSSILDLQKSQPCISFINGTYYGIYNIRTLYNEQYFTNKYGIVPEDVVVIKNPSGGIGDEIQAGFQGDEIPFNQLYQFIEKNDMKIEENYAYVETQIDIDNYIEYNILEIYCGNEDWPANNVRIWRKRTAKYEPEAPYGNDGRWRWLIFDLDYGLGLFGRSYQADTLAMATAVGSTNWNNPDEYTLMLRSLLQNETFKNKFVSRFADLLNTRYSSKTVLEKLNSFQAMYTPYIEEHLKRWNLHRGKIENWMAQVDVMKNYVIHRPHYMRNHICKYFGLDTVEFYLTVGEGGKVRVNTIELDSNDTTWYGIYFKGIPVELEAIPQEGYQFVGWKGTFESENPSLTEYLTTTTSLHAIFKKADEIS